MQPPDGPPSTFERTSRGDRKVAKNESPFATRPIEPTIRRRSDLRATHLHIELDADIVAVNIHGQTIIATTRQGIGALRVLPINRVT
jgi:hypothetical protein